jgi:uncharacterized membrane protein HdeD (DUF308 family)
MSGGAQGMSCIQRRHSLTKKEEHFVKIIGVVLIIAGVAALIYGGFTFTTKKKAVDMGPIQIDKTEHHDVPLPPLLGVVAIIGGGALFYFGAKEGK